MTQTPHPLALTPALPSELLTYILTHQYYLTTVIICQPRATFLSSLQRCMPNTVQRQTLPSAEVEPSSTMLLDDNELSGAEIDSMVREGEKERKQQRGKRHPLLIATLHQIAKSRYVDLVFVQTLSHLRACLSVFPPPHTPEKGDELPGKQFEKQGNRRPLLVVYGLVALHRDTSEWSVQGLGNSTAGLVEAGKRAGREVVVIEAREYDAFEGGDKERRNMQTGWDERLPMLNGSVRRTGLESDDDGWSGRTVEVGRVLGRWFRFERGVWDEHD